MELETLKTLGQIAGIGGIAVGVLLIVLRSIIGKKIFPSLSPEQSYKIFRLIIIVVFFVSVIGVVSWVYISEVKEGNGKSIFSGGNKITVLGRVVDSLSKPVRNAKVEIEEFPGIFNLTDDNGLYVLELSGKGQKFVEFKVSHGSFRTLLNKVRIDFDTQPPEINIPKFLMKIKTASEKLNERNPENNVSDTKENLSDSNEQETLSNNNLAVISIAYLGDVYNCSLDLRIKIGNKTERLISNNAVIRGVPMGVVNYTITGTISCLGESCEVNSSSSIYVIGSGQLYLKWLYESCEAFLSDNML